MKKLNEFKVSMKAELWQTITANSMAELEEAVNKELIKNIKSKSIEQLYEDQMDISSYPLWRERIQLLLRTYTEKDLKRNGFSLSLKDSILYIKGIQRIVENWQENIGEILSRDLFAQVIDVTAELCSYTLLIKNNKGEILPLKWIGWYNNKICYKGEKKIYSIPSYIDDRLLGKGDYFNYDEEDVDYDKFMKDREEDEDDPYEDDPNY